MGAVDPRFSKKSVTTLRKEAEAEAQKKAEAEEAKRQEEQKKAQISQRAAEEEEKKLQKVLKEIEMERWSVAQAPSVSRRQIDNESVDERPSTPAPPSAANYADLETQIDIEQELQRNFDTMDEHLCSSVEDADVAVPRYLKQVDKTMPQFDLWANTLAV